MFLLQEERKKLTERIQNAGTEVVEAKAGAVSTANHHFHAWFMNFWQRFPHVHEYSFLSSQSIFIFHMNLLLVYDFVNSFT